MAEVLHKDQYKAYVLQVLHVEMSKSELHTTVDARRCSIQLVIPEFSLLLLFVSIKPGFHSNAIACVACVA